MYTKMLSYCGFIECITLLLLLLLLLQLKSVGPKLVPFFKTVAIYFVIYGESGLESIFHTLIKCLPIASLIIFVLLHGMSFSEYYSYTRKVKSLSLNFTLRFICNLNISNIHSNDTTLRFICNMNIGNIHCNKLLYGLFAT